MSDTRQEFLHNSGANIFYSEYFPADPQAPTLILLHGNGEDHTYFVKQIPAFSPHFRLVLMDTRGQGQSTGGDGELNYPRPSKIAHRETAHIGNHRKH